MAEEVGALQEWVTGRVLYRTEYGDELPAAGVLVSTDQAVAVTDGQGRYRLPVAGEDCFVKVTTPRGWRAGGPWHYPLGAGPTGGEESSIPRDFCLVPDPARDHDAFSFIQVTDLHLGFTGFGGHEPLADDLQAILSEWRPQPAFFAVTGDLSDHGKVSELAACRKVLDALPVPYFPLPGNHDYFDGDSPAAYREVFGPTSYSFDWGPVHFVAYDTIADGPDAPGRKWLAADLAAQAPGKPVILLLHYQLGEEFFGLWREHSIVASISGHWHSSRVWHDGYVTHYNGPCLSFGGIDYSPRGFRVFRWRDGRLTAETVALSTQKGGVAVWSGAARRKEAGRAAGGAPEATGRTARGESDLPVRWRRRLPGRVHMASPVAGAGRIYVATTDEDGPGRCRVMALDPEDGSVLWNQYAGDSVKNRLSFGGGLIYGVTVTGNVFALAAESGEPVWRRQMDDPSLRWVYSAPVYADGRLYVGTAGHFLCLDAASGDVVWERTDLGKSDWISSYTSPSLAGSVLVLGFVWQPWPLYGLDAETGQTLWSSARTEGNVSALTATGEGYVYALRHPGVLQKLVAATGEVVWATKGLARWSPATPAVAQGRVFVASGERVLCYEAQTGDLVWAYEHSWEGGAWPDVYPYGRGRRAILGSPVVGGERFSPAPGSARGPAGPAHPVVWVACGDGSLVALDAGTGTLRGRHGLGAPIYTTPLPVAGAMVVVDSQGVVHAVAVDTDAVS